MQRSRMLALVAVVLAVSTGLMAALSTIRDRNHHAPAQAYERWFRGPVPPGVTDLQVAGRWWERGQPVWFRFTATPAAMETVSTAFVAQPFDRKALLTFKPGWDRALAEHDPHHRLRWSELYTIRSLENSQRMLYNDALMWVDRKTHTVFVYCFGYSVGTDQVRYPSRPCQPGQGPGLCSGSSSTSVSSR